MNLRSILAAALGQQSPAEALRRQQRAATSPFDVRKDWDLHHEAAEAHWTASRNLDRPMFKSVDVQKDWDQFDNERAAKGHLAAADAHRIAADAHRGVADSPHSDAAAKAEALSRVALGASQQSGSKNGTSLAGSAVRQAEAGTRTAGTEQPFDYHALAAEAHDHAEEQHFAEAARLTEAPQPAGTADAATAATEAALREGVTPRTSITEHSNMRETASRLAGGTHPNPAEGHRELAAFHERQGRALAKDIHTGFAGRASSHMTERGSDLHFAAAAAHRALSKSVGSGDIEKDWDKFDDARAAAAHREAASAHQAASNKTGSSAAAREATTAALGASTQVGGSLPTAALDRAGEESARTSTDNAPGYAHSEAAKAHVAAAEYHESRARAAAAHREAREVKDRPNNVPAGGHKEDDRVRVRGNGGRAAVRGEGRRGTIESSHGSFHVVRLDNGTSASYHESDLHNLGK